MNKKPTVAIIMGSDSDYDTLKPAISFLKKCGIAMDVQVMSAHRTPDLAKDYAKNAEKQGIDVVIAAAGKAAHLPGVIAAFTTLPVIGVPINCGEFDGMDALLSIVQMPSGIPVATVGVNAAENAAILAVQMLSLKYPSLKEELSRFKEELKIQVMNKNQRLKEKLRHEGIETESTL